MSYKPETPFDNLESSHEYVALMTEIIQDVRKEIEVEIARAGPDEQRRKEALQLVCYHLSRLFTHMTTSSRILNDLRTLRRLLLGERQSLSHNRT